uniref:C2 domain-containing protein n=1 Tax=Globodera rostochiensis TaxID=31243 RepID=A0A914H4P4_GLORO
MKERPLLSLLAGRISLFPNREDETAARLGAGNKPSDQLIIAAESLTVPLLLICGRMERRTKREEKTTFFVKGKAPPQPSQSEQSHATTTVKIYNARKKQLEVRWAAKKEALIETDAESSAAGAQLLRSSAGGDVEILGSLLGLENAVQLVQETRNKFGATALHLAAGNGREETLRMLLEAGGRAQSEAGDDDGETALHWAAREGHVEVVRILLMEATANLNVCNGHGETALRQALLNGRDEVAQLLVESGADSEATTTGGHTEEHYQMPRQLLLHQLKDGENEEGAKVTTTLTLAPPRTGDSAKATTKTESIVELERDIKPSRVRRLQESLFVLSRGKSITTPEKSEENVGLVTECSSAKQDSSSLLVSEFQFEAMNRNASADDQQDKRRTPANKTIRSMFVNRNRHGSLQEAMLLNKSEGRGRRNGAIIRGCPWCILCCLLLLLLIILLLLIFGFPFLSFVQAQQNILSSADQQNNEQAKNLPEASPLISESDPAKVMLAAAIAERRNGKDQKKDSLVQQQQQQQEKEMEMENNELIRAAGAGEVLLLRAIVAKWSNRSALMDLNRALLSAACDGTTEAAIFLVDQGAEPKPAKLRQSDFWSKGEQIWHKRMTMVGRHCILRSKTDMFRLRSLCLKTGNNNTFCTSKTARNLLPLFFTNWGTTPNADEVDEYIRLVEQWQIPNKKSIVSFLQTFRLTGGSIELPKDKKNESMSESDQQNHDQPMQVGVGIALERPMPQPKGVQLIADMPLGMEINRELSRAISSADVGFVRVLLGQWRHNLSHIDMDGALLSSACEGQTDIVWLLLDANANLVTRGGPTNYTPLHCAAKFGRAETVRLLLKRGAKVCERDDNGWTPLHYAANFGHEQTTLLLLEQGGWDTQLKDNEGMTPMDRALWSRNRRATTEDIDAYLRRAQQWHIPNQQTIVTFLLESRPRTPVVPQQVEQPTVVGAKSLNLAVREGKPEEVLVMLTSGANVNAMDAEGYHQTPLHEAVIAPDEAMVKLLLDHGANVNAFDGSGLTPLHRAAALNRIRIMHLLLRSGANVSAQQTMDSMNLGKTPLHFAAKNGDVAAINLLLKNGADPKARDDRGLMALHYAVLNGHEEATWALLHRCQDISDVDIQSVFDTIDRQKLTRSSEETATTLMQRWIALLVRANRAYRYHKWMFLKAVERGDVDGFASIMANYSGEELDLNEANDEFGNRALHFASLFGRADLVLLLLSRGANAMHVVELLLQQANVEPNWTNQKGKTALHFTVDELSLEELADKLRRTLGRMESEQKNKTQDGGHSRLYAEIMSLGEKDEQSQDSQNWTALQYAIKHWRRECIGVLVQFWAKRGLTSEELNGAIDQTSGQGEHTEKERILSVLRNAKAQLEAHRSIHDVNIVDANTRGRALLDVRLLNGAKAGDTQLVRHLLAYGADINRTRNAYGNNALHLAATYGHLDTVRLLLEWKADVSARNSKQKTALYYASCEGKELVAQELIRAGAEVNTAGTDGDAPLHCAAEEGWSRVMQLLMENGANVNLINARGYVPLHLSAMYGRFDAVSTLLSGGANPCAKAAPNGVTPLHLAAQEGHEQIVRLLLLRGAEAAEMDARGWTALHYAVKYARIGCVGTLMKRWQGPLSVAERESVLALASEANNLSLCVPHLGEALANTLIMNRRDGRVSCLNLTCFEIVEPVEVVCLRQLLEFNFDGGREAADGPAEAVELILSASGLPNADTFSKSDPFCVVEEVQGPDKSVEIGRTECIQNCLSPRWHKKILVTEEPQKELRFSIYDSDSNSRALTFHDFLGRCQCRLSDILSSPNGSLIMRLKKDRDVIAKGQLQLFAEKFAPSGETIVSFECRGLLSSPQKRWSLKPNIVTVIPSAYLEFYRIETEHEMLMFHRTETKTNTWNPEWKIFDISLRHLCQGKFERTFLIRCFAHQAAGNHQLVGEVKTSVKALTVERQWRVELVDEQKRLKKHDMYKTEGHLHFIHVQLKGP